MDDSTRQVYGPTTTQYIFSDQIINNQLEYHPVDTSINRLEKQTLMERQNWKYQNLGNFGTATFDSYLRPQETIGRTSGYNVFKPYLIKPSEIKFYDTKSPFIELGTYLGGNNRNAVGFNFTQNIKAHWNAGFQIRVFTSDKQIARQSKGDRQTGSNAYTAFTHYIHPKVPYQVLASYSYLNHKVIENGGVRFGSDSVLTEYFQYRNSLTRLVEAENLVKLASTHLYQDYRIADQFQLYHDLTIESEENTYRDFEDATLVNNYDTYREYYPDYFIDADSTYERSTFESMTNEVGLKGDFANIFYRAYVKLRNVDFSYARLEPTKTTEEYLGGYVRFNWRDQLAIIAEGELLSGGEYKFEGDIKSNVLNLSYLTLKYNVPFIYNQYFGNHFEWSNNFDPVFANRIDGDVNLDFDRFYFRPKASLTSYGNFLFFNQNREPQQVSGTSVITSLGADLNTRFINVAGEGLYLDNEVVVATSSGASQDALRLPPLLFNGRYYFKGKWFNNQVPIETGVGFTTRSSYFAYAYEPSTQQFYLEDDQDIFGYLRTDLFLNMKLTNFYFSFKWNYFNQPSDGGYFATPYHPSSSRSIDLIVRWLFFD